MSLSTFFGSSLPNTPNPLLSANIRNRCSRHFTFQDLGTVNWQWLKTIKGLMRVIYISCCHFHTYILCRNIDTVSRLNEVP